MILTKKPPTTFGKRTLPRWAYEYAHPPWSAKVYPPACGVIAVFEKNRIESRDLCTWDSVIREMAGQSWCSQHKTNEGILPLYKGKPCNVTLFLLFEKNVKVSCVHLWCEFLQDFAHQQGELDEVNKKLEACWVGELQDRNPLGWVYPVIVVYNLDIETSFFVCYCLLVFASLFSAQELL